MNHLVPCPECGRHVRVSEPQCPFCALPLDLAGTPEPRLPSVRLSRAATLAFGATFASATALAACSGTDAPVPIYGAPNFAGSGGAGTGRAGTGGSGGARSGHAGARADRGVGAPA